MSQGRIRLLTANLLNGSADSTAFADLCARLGADVVAVQELAPEQAAALAQVLPHGKLEPGLDFNGMGIALRHPGEVQRLPLQRRDARVAELSAPDWGDLTSPLEILNVHIQAPHTGFPPRTFATRRAQVQGVTAYLDEVPRARRVLAGDLNATTLWPAYRRLASRLRDAAQDRAAALAERPARTWGPWLGGPRLFRIDHVLVDGLGVTHCEVVDVRGSDHGALLVEIDPTADGVPS